MKFPKLAWRATAATLLIAATGLQSASAADPWPDRPVRMVVPYTPGGATDAVARLITERMGRDTKWTFIVDNRSGGNGNIGMDLVAKSKADGYTLAMGQTANMAINPALFSKMPYDVTKDFTPISIVASQPVVLIVRAEAPWKTVADVVAAAKAKPGELKQALAATGTLGHMAGELLAVRAGFKLLNVPYKGAAPAMTDLMGGQTDYMFGTPQAVLPMVKAGKVRALAVTSKARLQVMPDVPTMQEAGFKGFEAVDWKAIVGPAGTPPAVVTALNAAVNKALSDPKTIAQLLAEGSAPVGGTAQAAAKYVEDEMKQWAAVIKDANIKLD